MHVIIYICEYQLALCGNWLTIGGVLVWHLVSVYAMHYILPLLTKQQKLKMLLTLQQYGHKLSTMSYAYVHYSAKLIY